MRPRSVTSGALVVCFLLCLSGCLELVKRTDPPWERDAARTGAGRSLPPAMPASEHLEQPDSAASGTVRTGSSGSPARVRAATTLTRQTNKFALWSIRRGMWNEARTHMERQAEKDSGSAALQNNLGIVYEYLSLADRAETAYGKAVALEPRNMVYAENYRRFRRNKVSTSEYRGGAGTSSDPPGALADTSTTGL